MERNKWVKSITHLHNNPSKSFCENFSEVDISKKKSKSSFDSPQTQKNPLNGEKTSIKPTEKGKDVTAEYNNNSVFSKFYILNENNEIVKYPKRESKFQEEEVLTKKRQSAWGQLFCCYIDSSKYE